MRIVTLSILISLSLASSVEAQTPPPPQGGVRTEPAPRPVQAPPATASESALAKDRGWDGSWALLFAFNNLFTSNPFLSPYFSSGTAGVGASYHLSPKQAVRAGIAFSRTSNPPTIQKTTSETGGESVTREQHSRPDADTSSVRTGLRLDLLQRLLASAVAPYAGLGAFADWTRRDRDWRDDVSVVDQVTEVDDDRTEWDLGLHGLLGAEWRIHPSFAFFAEYELRASVYRHTDVDNDTRVESTVGGERTVERTRSESSTSSWLNLATGMPWGFQLGLAVHFR